MTCYVVNSPYPRSMTYDDLYVTISNKGYHIRIICNMVVLTYNINNYHITMTCYMVNSPYHRIMPYGNHCVNIWHTVVNMVILP